jgi:hypothetical protein
MIYLLLLSALSLSTIAAWYAIAGLIAIFAALPIPIMIMGGALEASKLVVASWLYTNWKQIPVLMKSYFTVALVVLMMLTSMGIFGYLSKAHLDQTLSTGDNTLQIELIDQKISREQQKITDSETVLKQLDGAVQALVDYDRIRGKDGAIAVRESQKAERETLTKVIDTAADSISTLQQEKLVLSKEQLQLEAEVGPIKYIAALIYGEQESKSMLEEAVRVVILMIVFVFDPLAVLMVMAASRELSSRKKVETSWNEFFEQETTVTEDFNPRGNDTEINLSDSIEVEDRESLNIQDDVPVHESNTPDKEKRKVGRLLAEIEKTKTNRTKSFLKRAEKVSGSDTIDDGEEGETPFSN